MSERHGKPFDREREYMNVVGHEPPEIPDTHPLRWQWDYRGSPEERDDLLRRLQQGYENACGQLEIAEVDQGALF